MSEPANQKDPKETASQQLAGLEKWAHETFDTNNPIKLPEVARKWIAENAWWLAVIGGVLSLFGAYGMWDSVYRYENSELLRAIGYSPAANLGVWWYLMLGLILVEGILMLLAVPKLRADKKTGWNLLFYSSLVTLVYGVVGLFSGYGFSYLFGTLLGVAIAWTILMQIRNRFN